MSRLDLVLLGVGLLGVVAVALLTANDLGWEPLRYSLGIGGGVLISGLAGTCLTWVASSNYEPDITAHMCGIERGN